MALATYANLQTQVSSWLGRDDLTGYIPDFITLFEAYAARKMRLRPAETSTTLTPSSGSVSLPSDYLGWRRVTWTGSPRRDLDYVHPSLLQSYYPSTPSGTPTVFTIEGGTLKIRPTDTTGLEFDYFAKNTALSSSLNWLYTSYPDAYLFGTLVEAYLFDEDAEMASVWAQRRDGVFDDIRKADFRNPGSLAIRVAGVTP